MLSTLRASVRAKINEPLASVWSDSIINSNINNAKKDLYLALRTVSPKLLIKSGTISSVSTTTEYNLPADFSSLYWIYSENFFFIPMDSSRERFKNLMGTGNSNIGMSNPCYYDIYANDTGNYVIKFAPGITSNIEYKYMSKMSDLVNDSDTFPYEELFEPFITNRAAFYCLLSMPSGDHAKYERLAKEALTQIINAVSNMELIPGRTAEEY